MNTFTLTIKLGNAAMSEPEDVAEALTRAAGLIQEYGFDAPKSLIDQNGNRVGSWAVSE